MPILINELSGKQHFQSVVYSLGILLSEVKRLLNKTEIMMNLAFRLFHRDIS